MISYSETDAPPLLETSLRCWPKRRPLTTVPLRTFRRPSLLTAAHLQQCKNSLISKLHQRSYSQTGGLNVFTFVLRIAKMKICSSLTVGILSVSSVVDCQAHYWIDQSCHNRGSHVQDALDEALSWARSTSIKLVTNNRLMHDYFRKLFSSPGQQGDIRYEYRNGRVECKWYSQLPLIILCPK